MKRTFVIDLSSNEIVIYDIDRSKVYREKNYLAYKLNFDFSDIQVESKNLYAFGNDAFEFFERAPKDIEVFQCIENNRVIDISEQSELIRRIFKKYNLLSGMSTPNIYLISSKTFTNFEKEINKKSIPFNKVNEIELEDIILKMPQVENSYNSLVIRIDQDNSFIMSTYNGEKLFIKPINFNARKLDESLQKYVKFTNKVNISLKSAAEAREQLGIINILGNSIEIPAIEIKTGLPTKFKLMDKLIQHIYKESVRNLIDEVNKTLKRLPKEMVYECLSNPFLFSGQLANDYSLIKIIAKRFGTTCDILNIDDYIISNNSIFKNGEKDAKKK